MNIFRIAGAMTLALFLAGCNDTLPGKSSASETATPPAAAEKAAPEISKNATDPVRATPTPSTAETAKAAPSGTRIAVINTGKIFQDSKGGKAGAAHLDALGKELQAELVKLQAETQDGKNKQAMEKLQERLAQMQQRFEAEQQMVLNTLNAAYQKAVDQCRKEDGIDLVINEDTALSFSPNIDISQKVIARMDLTPVVYTPLAPENSSPSTAPATKSGNATMSGNATAVPAKPANATAPETSTRP